MGIFRARRNFTVGNNGGIPEQTGKIDISSALHRECNGLPVLLTRTRDRSGSDPRRIQGRTRTGLHQAGNGLSAIRIYFKETGQRSTEGHRRLIATKYHMRVDFTLECTSVIVVYWRAAASYMCSGNISQSHQVSGTVEGQI